MPEITDMVAWLGQAFVLVLAVSVVTRILTGGIRTTGLIAGTTASGRRFVSAGRVQLLVATVTAAVQYVSQAVQDPKHLPDIPQTWLVLLGGSHLVYLGTKLQGRLNNRYRV